MATEVVTFRIAPEMKAKLEALAAEQGCGNSDVIRLFLDLGTAIPRAQLKALAEEAELRGIPKAKLFRGLMRYALEHLRFGLMPPAYWLFD